MDDIKPFAALRITGTERISFLQGQLSNDLQQLQADRPLFASWSNPQGRLLCTVWVIDWQDAAWLLLPADLAETVAKRLKMFVLRAAVQIEIASHSPQLLLTSTPDNDVKPENNYVINCFYDDYFYTLQVCRGAAIRIQTSPADSTGDAVLHRLWRLQTIRAGVPIIWSATSGEFVPQMVNLDLLGGISFTKGCYVGQEIVARTQNLGRIKRRMYAYTTTALNDPQAGDPVYGPSGIAGQIVSCARASADRSELLAVIKLDSLGLPLSLQDDGRDVLSPMPLPYQVPEQVD